MPASSSADRKHKQWMFPLHLGLILLALAGARFLFSAEFGFYEDDYTLVARAMAAPSAEVIDFIAATALDFGAQGRPLQDILIFLLGHLADSLGGIQAAYWLSFAIVGLNCLLFYALLRRLYDPLASLIGGLAYALYAADTTQAFLYHALGLQPALTFLLLAFHAYLSRRHLLPYLLILGSLLSYETAFPLFLAAPLLERDWDARWRRRAAAHVGVVILLLALAAGLRFYVGEGRVQALGWPEVILTPLTHIVVGPAVALGSYALRPLQALQQFDSTVGLLSLAGSLLFLVVFLVTAGRVPNDHKAPRPSPKASEQLPAGREPEADRPAWRQWLAGARSQFLPAGFAMLALAYPLTFTIRAHAISGRDTRVHLAAVAAAGLLWAGFAELALRKTARLGLRRLLLAAIAGILGLNLGFGTIVQRDYARAWDLQQRFWSSLIEYAPDAGENTVILVDPAGMLDTQYIGANTWNLPLVFQYIYDFPAAWEEEPRVHRLIPDWRSQSLTNPLEIKAVDYRYQYVVNPWEETIVLATAGGRVVDRWEQVEVRGETHELKPQEPGAKIPFPTGYFFEELIRPGDN